MLEFKEQSLSLRVFKKFHELMCSKNHALSGIIDAIRKALGKPGRKIAPEARLFVQQTVERGSV